MQTSRLRLTEILILLAATSAAFGQGNVYSINVVGYYNRNVVAGDNLIANQLGYGTGGQYSNTLDNVLTYGVADGSTFTEWDPTANAFLPLSVFNAAQTNWSINYTFNLGQGGVLHSPVATTCTFVGELDGSIYNINTGEYNWNPGYGPGYYLLSCPVPFSDETFQEIVGRDPTDGEWVKILNEATQTYTVTTYHDGLGWDNGDPDLGVGQAAWFDLGPVVVPEPSAGLLLAAACTVTLLRKRRQNPAGNRRQ
jgi:hypothetical protein